MQQYSRTHSASIDTVTMEFEFLNVYDDNEVSSKPPYGCYVSGMFLEGARWDSGNGCLAESKSGVLFSRVPIVWFKPETTRKRTSNEFYSCPVYRTFQRAGVGANKATTGQSANFVTPIDIPSKEEEKFWIKRGVACSLSD